MIMEYARIRQIITAGRGTILMKMLMLCLILLFIFTDCVPPDNAVGFIVIEPDGREIIVQLTVIILQ
jgi:hypothetical protein